VKRLIALHPARWRQRYGTEMARAVIAWIPWGAGIALANAVFPTRQDNDGLWVVMTLEFAVLGIMLAAAGGVLYDFAARMRRGAI
jgi:hypothetical protein